MPRFIVLALLVFGTAACIREPDPFDLETEVPSVHLVLVAGADSAAALITRPTTSGTALVLTDARVRLISGPDTATLLLDAETPCADGWDLGFGGPPCYRATLPAPVRAGATYELEIVLAGGSRITGRTTVPRPVELTQPAQGLVLVADCRDADTCYGEHIDQPPYILPVAEMTVRWNDPQDSERVLVAVTATEAFRGGTSYPGSICHLGFTFRGPTVAGDSIYWPISGIGCAAPLSTARFDSIRGEVTIAAPSPEYGRYLDALDDGQTTRASSVSEGLEGAWGVFGAIAPARRAFTVVRSPAPAP